MDRWLAEKECAFSGKGYCEKCTGKEQQRKRIARRVNCKIKMRIICVKGSCFETPLYVHVLGTKWDGDKDRLIERGGAEGGGGGGDTRR